jgi:NAD(P)-dependent dehydrogenase (short-subunit alcohol dehydrogenase family)
MVVARDAEELGRAAEDLRKMGAAVQTKTADIIDEMTPDAAVAETIANFGRLDVLVNNAGIISVAPLANLSEADFQDAMKTHFWAPLRFTNAALPFLKGTADAL